MTVDVRAKRVYDAAEPGDGYRVLIDHVWPRGVPHERANLDEWARDWRPVTSCANGSTTFPSGSTSFALATAVSLPCTARASRICAAARAKGR